MNKVVHVAVGVIVSGEQVFLTKRADDAHQGGKWEFPGGKVEQGEGVAAALHRELQEEVGIDVLSCIPLIDITHDYSDKVVRLETFIVDNYQGEPSAQEGQEEAWFEINAIDSLDFPKANVAIVEALQAYYTQ
ncbi:8-oxo-dGTP diphosphatase MutT [Thalassotalea fusca]